MMYLHNNVEKGCNYSVIEMKKNIEKSKRRIFALHDTDVIEKKEDVDLHMRYFMF